MAHIQKAAEAYITTNAAAVEANSTASSPAVITVPMLVNTGYLPLGFNSMNPYGQTWEVQVLQPAANQLQALVLGIGGAAIPAKQSGMVATTAGDSGGVIGGGTGDYAVPGCANGEACGAYAGWSVSTAGYQNVAAAHPAALIEYANNQLQSDYLYRVAVPGQPQLNTMQTNLNMGNNTINNAQAVQLAAGGAFDGDQGGSLELGGNNGTPGIGTPYIDFHLAGQGVQDYNARIINNANSTLAVEGANGQGSLQAQGTIVSQSGSNYAAMTANNNNNPPGNPEIYTNGTIDSNAMGSNSFGTFNGSWWANNAGNSSQTGQASASEFYTSGDVRFQQTGYSAGGSCNGVAVVNGYANGNAGQLLYCQNGQWQAMGGQMYFDVGSTGHGNTNFAAWNLGNWDYCGLIGAGNASNGEDTVYPSGGPYSNGQYTWYYESDGNVNSDDGWICGNYMPG